MPLANRGAVKGKVWRGSGGTAIELRNRTGDAARNSPSPPHKGRRGSGRGGPFSLGFPSPRPSPHSFLAGRGRRPEATRPLNSMAVPLIPLPAPFTFPMQQRGERILLKYLSRIEPLNRAPEMSNEQ